MACQLKSDLKLMRWPSMRGGRALAQQVDYKQYMNIGTLALCSTYSIYISLLIWPSLYMPLSESEIVWQGGSGREHGQLFRIIPTRSSLFILPEEVYPASLCRLGRYRLQMLLTAEFERANPA